MLGRVAAMKPCFLLEQGMPRRPMTLTLDPTRWGVQERTGSASESVWYAPVSRDEFYDDETDNEYDCSFRPLLLLTGQLGEREDGRRSAKVDKVVGDGGGSIPSGTGDQWMPGRCAGEVLRVR